ncbi:crossover junction endonuclease EME1 isoform X2 [Cimex lectularius]|uniref:Crossover junction endonuclease EME1 n=1 Tax=Cimex lectularius TaxID=79782 RepID=A0A8I6TKX7_CIMLE|nr:crossover junction endonuclease EME1 isoform X2 [Cimex lectularius]
MKTCFTKIQIVTNLKMEELYNSPLSSPLPGAPRRKLIDVCGNASKGRNLIHSMSESDEEETVKIIEIPLSNHSNDSHQLQTNSTKILKPTNSSMSIIKSTNKKKKLSHEKKMKESSEKKAVLQEVEKRIKPGECSKFITTIMSEDLFNYNWGEKAYEILQAVPSYKLRVGDMIFNEAGISWERAIPGTHDGKENVDHCLICWPCERFIGSIKEQTLLSTFLRYKTVFSQLRIYLAVFSLDEYVKTISEANNKSKDDDGSTLRRKQKLNFDINRKMIQRAMVEMELKTGISVINVNNYYDLVSLIQQLTKIISELPYRMITNKVEDKIKWHVRGESKDCVRVDKDLNGLQQLWVQQLSQFNLTNLDTAKSIAEVYPSPYSLFDAYNSVSSELSKELLLQDIYVKKRQNAVGKSRVGPELSKKLYAMFNEEDGML